MRSGNDHNSSSVEFSSDGNRARFLRESKASLPGIKPQNVECKTPPPLTCQHGKEVD